MDAILNERFFSFGLKELWQRQGMGKPPLEGKVVEM